jgi:hypothetical protein
MNSAQELAAAPQPSISYTVPTVLTSVEVVGWGLDQIDDLLVKEHRMLHTWISNNSEGSQTVYRYYGVTLTEAMQKCAVDHVHRILPGSFRAYIKHLDIKVRASRIEYGIWKGGGVKLTRNLEDAYRGLVTDSLVN